MADTKKSSLVSPVVRLSYVTLFAARLPQKAKPGDRARYQVTGLILPPEKMDAVDQQRLLDMRKAALDVALNSELGKERATLMLKEGKLKLLRDDVESSGFPADFKYFFRAWTYGIGASAAGPNGVPAAVIGAPPAIVSIYRGPDGKPTEIKDPNKVYSGVWARMSLKPFFTNFEKKNPAISWQLNNVQVVRDDDRLDGRMAAQDEFDATDDMPAGMDLGSPGGASGGGDAAELAALLGGT